MQIQVGRGSEEFALTGEDIRSVAESRHATCNLHGEDADFRSPIFRGKCILTSRCVVCKLAPCFVVSDSGIVSEVALRYRTIALVVRGLARGRDLVYGHGIPHCRTSRVHF